MSGGIAAAEQDLRHVLEQLGADRPVRLPMRATSRSLNLSNAAAVVLFEAWRQAGFDGGA